MEEEAKPSFEKPFFGEQGMGSAIKYLRGRVEDDACLTEANTDITKQL